MASFCSSASVIFCCSSNQAIARSMSMRIGRLWVPRSSRTRPALADSAVCRDFR
jgi:hypothetical protein